MTTSMGEDWLSLAMSLIMSIFCYLFPHEVSWMRSGTKLNQVLKFFFPTLVFVVVIKLLLGVIGWCDGAG